MIHLDDDEPETPEDPDVPEPRGPEPKEPGDNRTLSSPINELESRLLKQGADLRRHQRQGRPGRDRPPARTGQ